MGQAPEQLDNREARLDAVVADYLEAAEAGRAPGRDEFLMQYPDLASDLASFLDDRAMLEQLIGPTSASRASDHTCPDCQSPLQSTADGSTRCGLCGKEFGRRSRCDPFASGHRIGRIELREVLGRGTFGTVYKGWDEGVRRAVAVKVLRPDPFTPTENVRRFEREAAATAQLEHRGIARVYDFGWSGNVPYLVSEFIEGPTLAELLKGGRLPLARAVEIVAAVADALHEAHGKNIVHRDVKPSNVLLRNGTVPVVADFGLAVWEESDTTLTTAGKIIGTVAYMSPEQARGDSHHVDKRCDVYSLGVVLYELLTGLRPFEGTAQAVLTQIASEEPRRPRVMNATIPRDLETICLKCLQKEPANRYATAAELAEDLRCFRDGRPIQARPVGFVERQVRWSRRNPALATAAGLVAAFMIATSVVSVAWAVDSARKTTVAENALTEAQRVTAESLLDRGLADAARGEVGPGLLRLAQGVGECPAGADDLAWTLRANAEMWSRHHYSLTDCVTAPPGPVLALTADGRAAWFVEAGGTTVRRWSLAAKQIDGPRLVHGSPVQAVAVRPDGRQVACGTRQGLHIWNAETGDAEPGPNVPEVVGLTYTEGGQKLLLGVRLDKQKVTIYQTWDGSSLTSTDVIAAQVGATAIAFDPLQNCLMTASLGDRTVRQWDTPTGQYVNLFLRHPAPVKCLAFSADGRTLLTGSGDRTARLWDVQTGQVIATFAHQGAVTAVAFADEGKVLTASAGDAIRVWSPNRTAMRIPDGGVGILTVQPNGPLVATSNGRSVQVWRWDNAVLTPVGERQSDRNFIRSVSLRPDGQVLATTWWFKDGAQLTEPTTGRKLVDLPHAAHLARVVFSPDGQIAATLGFDRRARLWHTASGEPASTGSFPHDSGPWRSALFHASGQMLVTLVGNEVHRWDTATGQAIGEPLRHTGPIALAAFHPHHRDQLLVAGADGIARIWDTETGLPAGPVFQSGGEIVTACFSGDGRLVFTACADGTLRVWHTATGAEIQQYHQHSGKIVSLAVSERGDWAVTGSEDGSARVWAVALGRPLGPPIVHGKATEHVAVVDGGRGFITVGSDRMIAHKAPTPLTGTPAELARRMQALTGAELDDHGHLRVLDPMAWQMRSKTD